MKLEEVRPGQVVKLNTASPEMTVQFVTAKNTVQCKWFVVGHELREADFVPESLRLVKDSSGRS